LLWIIITPLVFGVPYGRISIKNYFKKVTVTRERYKRLIFILSVLITIAIIYGNYYGFVLMLSSGSPIPEIYLNFYLFTTIENFVIYFWQEFAFRGVILMLLMSKIKTWKAIILNSLFYSILNPRFLTIIPYFRYISFVLPTILIEWLFLFLPAVLASVIYIKVKNIFLTSSVVFSFGFIIRYLFEYLIILPYL
jgi:hypothetical protein